jgi:GT2 family glycosyltransferase
VLRKSLFDQIKGFRTGYDGAQDYDLLLRAVEQTDKIAHAPKPLYHWRMSKQSTSLNPTIKPQAHDNAKNALRDALSRRGIEGSVEDGNLPHFFRVRRRLVSTPLISIVIPFKDKPDLLSDCLTAILDKTTYPEFEILGVSNDTLTVTTYDVMNRFQKKDQRVRFVEHNVPFNFSHIVNYGVNESRGDHIVLFNNDIEIITPDWLESLLEHSQRPEVAAVGAKLYYPNNTIQHAGIMIGLGGYAGHAHKHFPATSEGYFNRLNILQNVSAVTGALMMVEHSIYDELGGFDEENFGIAYNDVDFCLRAMGKGYLNVFTPYVEAYHHESISRGYEDTREKIARFDIEKENLRQRHHDLIQVGDRYYNPNFDQGRDDFSI